MAKKYLIDTNVVNDFLRNALPPEGMRFIAKVINETPIISLITKIELFSFNAPEEEAQIIEDFVSSSKLIDFTDEIVQETIMIRKTARIKIPDALIAATAVVSNLVLITRNTSDFKGIVNLQMLDPYKKTRI
ncbi:MAG TPA: type II toxin-antitoxin system VapC family toxin [Segetibacter sp.]|jgi:hypothetical protein